MLPTPVTDAPFLTFLPSQWPLQSMVQARAKRVSLKLKLEQVTLLIKKTKQIKNNAVAPHCAQNKTPILSRTTKILSGLGPACLIAHCPSPYPLQFFQGGGLFLPPGLCTRYPLCSQRRLLSMLNTVPPLGGLPIYSLICIPPNLPLSFNFLVYRFPR